MNWIYFVEIELVPLLMAVFGWLMLHHCPKTINHLVGYRTRRSMVSNDTWVFAHHYCGRQWYLIGLSMAGITFDIYLPFTAKAPEFYDHAYMIVLWIQLAVMIIPVFFTEKALKEQFPENH